MCYNKNGFTLLEVLITIAISAILFTLTFVNLGHYKPDEVVAAHTEQFHSFLTLARNLAFSGVVFRDQDGDGEKEVPFGYGVHFEEGKYFIFGDLYWDESILKCSSQGNYGNRKYDTEVDNCPEKTGLTEGIIDVKKIGIEIVSDKNPQPQYPIDIFFESPKGQVSFYYNGALQESVDKINVKFFSLKEPSIYKTVVIQNTGEASQIYVE